MTRILEEKNGNRLVQLDLTLEDGEKLYSVGSVEYFAGKDESEIFKCTKDEMLKYLRSSLKGFEKSLERAREWHMDVRIPMLKQQEEAMQLFIDILNARKER